MAIDLYINTEARSLETAIVTGTKRPTESARIREFVQGADQDYILHLINTDGSYDSRSGDAAVAMRVGVSVRGGTAKTGKFTLTAGAITSEAISFGASASALEAALNRMNSGAGPYSDKVKAQKLGDGMWLIIFDTAGAQDALAAESLNLFPESGVIPNLYVTGTSTIRCQQIIRVARQPAIYSETWTAAGTTFTGTLDASTARVAQLLNDDRSAQVVFEVKADDTILCSVPCRILPAVADTSSFTGASLPTSATEAYVTAAIAGSRSLIGNTIFVAKNGTDTRTGLDPHDIRKPFLTVNAAQAVAVSGDTIMVFAGDYSAETALGGVDGVYYQGLDGATLPAFNVVTGITIYGSGLAQSLTCNHASAVMNFARMDAVTSITCSSGEQTAGNAGTYIECNGGIQAAGNAGTSIYCSSGEQTAGNAGTYIECYNGEQTAGNAGDNIVCYNGVQTAGNAGDNIVCYNGVQTAGNAGTSISCSGGVQNAGNAGTFIACSAGVQTITRANFTSTDRPVRLSGSGSLTITGRIESTQSNGVIVDISNNWSGTLNAVDCDLTATTVGGDGATIGINYGTGVTGNVQLKNCTIITAKNGSGTAKSIDAPSAQTVYVQGSLNQTHAVDSDITLAGGAAITNTAFTV